MRARKLRAFAAHVCRKTRKGFVGAGGQRRGGRGCTCVGASAGLHGDALALRCACLLLVAPTRSRNGTDLVGRGRQGTVEMSTASTRKARSMCGGQGGKSQEELAQGRRLLPSTAHRQGEWHVHCLGPPCHAMCPRSSSVTPQALPFLTPYPSTQPATSQPPSPTCTSAEPTYSPCSRASLTPYTGSFLAFYAYPHSPPPHLLLRRALPPVHHQVLQLLAARQRLPQNVLNRI